MVIKLCFNSGFALRLIIFSLYVASSFHSHRVEYEGLEFSDGLG